MEQSVISVKTGIYEAALPHGTGCGITLRTLWLDITYVYSRGVIKIFDSTKRE